MMFKKGMTGIIATAIAATFYMASMTPLFAQQADFTPCEVFKGASFGLCRAGLAAGCDTDTPPKSCTRIEAQFILFAGQDAPWLVPTGSCDDGAVCCSEDFTANECAAITNGVFTEGALCPTDGTRPVTCTSMR